MGSEADPESLENWREGERGGREGGKETGGGGGGGRRLSMSSTMFHQGHQ